MRFSRLSLRFAFVVSLSFLVSQTRTSFCSFIPLQKKNLIISLRTSILSSTHNQPTTDVAADLISLLGSKEEASRLSPNEAKDLKSCLRFLVPIASSDYQQQGFDRFLLETNVQEYRSSNSIRQKIDELVWWPPEPVMELARLAADSGGDPAAVHRALDPTIIPFDIQWSQEETIRIFHRITGRQEPDLMSLWKKVPDVEGCKHDRCVLTRTKYGRRFINKELNSYIAFLFETIAARGPSVGLKVTLSRYDLFHGHLFLAEKSGRLGILFHAKEYPEYKKKSFPYNMGYCQTGSNVKYDDLINLRNILWLAPLPSNNPKASPQWVAPGVLVVLDAHPGGIIYRDLVPDYVAEVRTIYEDDFGDVVVDVNYLNVGNVAPEDKIFIC